MTRASARTRCRRGCFTGTISRRATRALSRRVRDRPCETAAGGQGERDPLGRIHGRSPALPTGLHAERNGVSTQDTVKLYAAVAEADGRHGAARPRLRPGVAETIDYASHDCLWVRDRFGVVFPGLDYDRLAAAAPAVSPGPGRTFALEELIVIDRELQANILDSLAQSPWAADDAARTAWPGRRSASGRERLQLRRLGGLYPSSVRVLLSFERRRPLAQKNKNRRRPFRSSLSDI